MTHGRKRTDEQGEVLSVMTEVKRLADKLHGARASARQYARRDA
jgi:hypothetical protein